MNNLVGHAVTTGKVLLQSDGTPWRPLVHILDIIHAYSAGADARPARPSTTRRSTSARPARTTRSATWPISSPRSCPNCQVAFAPGASADARNYRVSFAKAETRAAWLPPHVDAARRHRGAVSRLHGQRPDLSPVSGTDILSAENRPLFARIEPLLNRELRWN